MTPPILYVRITLSKKGVVACEACSGFRQDVRKDRKPDDYFVKRDFFVYFFDAQKVFFFCAKDNLRIRIKKEETAHERSLQNDKR